MISYVREFDSYYQRKTDPEQIKILLAHQLRLKGVLKLIGSRNFQRALDIGCGEGHFCRLLSNKANEVCGIDVSKTALLRGLDGKAQAHSHFCLATLASLPFARRSFDLITCLEVLYYLDGPARLVAVKELSRVLSPGGLLIISITLARSTNPRTMTPYMNKAQLVKLLSNDFAILRWTVGITKFAYRFRNRQLYRLSLTLAHFFPPIRANLVLVAKRKRDNHADASG